MPDDKSNRGAADRQRVASEQPYEVSYFAARHGISIDDAPARYLKTPARAGKKRTSWPSAASVPELVRRLESDSHPLRDRPKVTFIIGPSVGQCQ